MNSYYRLVLAKREDGSYYTGAVQLGSIVEINVGIVVGCMPVIRPAVLSRSADLMRLFSVRSLFSPFPSSLRSSKRAAASSEQDPKGTPTRRERAGKPHLETQILNGADGDGRFMSSVGNTTRTQRSWLSRTKLGLGTWTGGRSHQGAATTDATACTEVHHNTHHPVPDDNIIVTTCLSLDSHGIQHEELHKHSTLRTEKISNMV